MDPRKTLDEAGALIGERGRSYGEIEQNFALIAEIATLLTGVRLDEETVALILLAVKLARRRSDTKKRDNYLDGINYLAFADIFATGGATENYPSVVSRGPASLADRLDAVRRQGLAAAQSAVLETNE